MWRRILRSKRIRVERSAEFVASRGFLAGEVSDCQGDWKSYEADVDDQLSHEDFCGELSFGGC